MSEKLVRFIGGPQEGTENLLSNLITRPPENCELYIIVVEDWRHNHNPEKFPNYLFLYELHIINLSEVDLYFAIPKGESLVKMLIGEVWEMYAHEKG